MIAFCLLLNVVKSEEDKYPLLLADAAPKLIAPVPALKLKGLTALSALLTLASV